MKKCNINLYSGPVFGYFIVFSVDAVFIHSNLPVFRYLDTIAKH